MIRHLKQLIRFPVWGIYLMIALFVIDDINDRNWFGLALMPAAGLAAYMITRARQS